MQNHGWSFGCPDDVEDVDSNMLDLLMIAIGLASFALLAAYLTACERA